MWKTADVHIMRNVQQSNVMSSQITQECEKIPLFVGSYIRVYLIWNLVKIKDEIDWGKHLAAEWTD